MGARDVRTYAFRHRRSFAALRDPLLPMGWSQSTAWPKRGSVLTCRAARRTVHRVAPEVLIAQIASPRALIASAPCPTPRHAGPRIGARTCSSPRAMSGRGTSSPPRSARRHHGAIWPQCGAERAARSLATQPASGPAEAEVRRRDAVRADTWPDRRLRLYGRDIEAEHGQPAHDRVVGLPEDGRSTAHRSRRPGPPPDRPAERRR